MSIAIIISSLPDYARDIRLNLESVLTPEGAPGLTREQIGAVALACAYSAGNKNLSSAVEAEFTGVGPETLEAAKAAATIMGMNNVYYRFVHLADDAEIAKMPARLRMNVIGKPGIAKVDFELMCLAVSALAGCGMCITSHMKELRSSGLSDEAIQSAVRIASVIQAAKQALAISP